MEGRREEEKKKRKVWRRGGWIIGSSFYVASHSSGLAQSPGRERRRQVRRKRREERRGWSVWEILLSFSWNQGPSPPLSSGLYPNQLFPSPSGESRREVWYLSWPLRSGMSSLAIDRMFSVHRELFFRLSLTVFSLRAFPLKFLKWWKRRSWGWGENQILTSFLQPR